MRKITAVLTLSFVLALSSAVRAEDSPPITAPTRVGSVTTCQTGGGTKLSVPAGSVLVPPVAWAALDVELKRLQTLEIRLTVENGSLRASLKKRPIPWYYVSAALAIGYGVGYAWKAVR